MWPISAFTTALKRSIEFSGRSARREYWGYALVYFIIYIALGVLTGAFSGMAAQMAAASNPEMLANPALMPEPPKMAFLLTAFSLLTLPASLSVTFRRLHDIGKSGLWFLIAFIPLIGAIVLLVF
nr:DUF805 domain-containing protein [Gemmatimonadaceae bacterium]